MTVEQESQDWWESFHVMEMADLFLERSSQQELNDTTQFLMDELRLSPGSQVYDQCCGVGTLSIQLAANGVRAIGADLCGAYIDRAKSDAEGRGLKCEFVCDDAYTFVPPSACDGVFNWYSSFGYADSDQRNQEMLQRAFDALRPGGFFAMDVPNFSGVLRGFQHHLVRTGVSGGRQVTCIRESKIDLRAGVLEQTWNWIVEGRPIDRRKSSLRIYFPHHISDMLSAVGFDVVELYGGLEKSRLDLDSPRLVVVARRPE